jgi:Tfp pilus assembly PilM family ATPase
MALGFLSDFFLPRAALGLTIGTETVKGVRLVRSNGGFEVAGVVSVAFPAEGEVDPAEIAAAAVGVTGALWDEKTRLVANVGARGAGLRFMTLAFDRPDKMMRVLKYEAEPLFLDPVDELLLDFLPLPGDDDGARRGAVIGTRPEAVSRVLGLLEPAGVDPRFVLPDRLGLLAAGLDLSAKRPEPALQLYLDLGAAQTGMALFRDGRPLAVRSFFYGGRDLTRALAEATGGDWASAEAAKKTLNLADPDDSPVGRALKDAWRPILIELERTLAAAGPPPEGEEPLVVVGGGGAGNPGLVEFLSAELGLDVDIVSDRAPGDLRPALLPPDFLVPYGLAILGLSRGYVPNLRQGELEPTQLLAKHRKVLAAMAAGILVVLGLGLGQLVYEYRIESGRYQAVKSELNRIFRETVPDVSVVVDPLAQMKQELEKAGAASLGPVRGKGYALDLLLEVSSVTGSHEGLRITDLSLNPERLEMSGEGGSFEAIDQLKTELSQLPYFREVTVGGARVDPNTKVLTFKLTLQRMRR